MTHPFKAVLLCFFTAYTFFCNALPNQPLVDQMTQYDLNLISALETNTLRYALGKTITENGKKVLDDFLCNPTDSIETLTQRQKNIIFFLDHKTLSEKLVGHFCKLSLSEEALVQNHNDPLAKKALEQVYFSLLKLKKFNTNPYALDVAYISHIAGLCAPLVEHVIMHIGIDLLAKKGDKKHHDHEHHKHHHGCQHTHHSSPDSNNMTYYSLQALHWGLHVPGLYDMVQGICNRALMIKLIQSQTIHIAQYVRSAQSIHALLKKDDADISFEPFARLEYFFSETPACSTDFKKLLNLLKKPTFSGQASVWNHVGNILAAYMAYSKVQKEFKVLTQAVSEIDVYLSVASMMQSQTEQQPWSFVIFNESHKKPQCILKNFRHLFVKNSRPLNFSSEESAYTLVTGDNGSGKSTYIHSIGHALILAQTFGIAPAAYCQLTPFSHISTFRFIEDNFAQGISRFYAECARMEKIIDGIKNSPRFSCVFIDEPFTFTTSGKGAKHLQEALAVLGKLEGSISLVATHYTHFDALTEGSWKQEHFAVQV